MLRTIILLRKSYNYFLKNKTWIISTLFVFSIIKTSFWYALFGINILSYSTLQDIFINFADYFMSFIYIGLSYILYLFVRGDRKSIKNFLFSALIFISFFSLFNIVFRMVVSVLTFLFIIASLSDLYCEKRKAELFGHILLLLLLFTLVQPLEQFLLSVPNRSEVRQVPTLFIEKPANYDTFSFEYSNMTINTDSEQFYYIGGNSSYYFILDRKKNEVMIIPKSECSNIKGSPLSFKKISKMFS